MTDKVDVLKQKSWSQIASELASPLWVEAAVGAALTVVKSFRRRSRVFQPATSSVARNLEDYVRSWTERNCRLGLRDTVIVEGVTLALRPGVFSPDQTLTHSSSMLVRVLPDLNGKTVLDIGTGCGVLATYAAMKGARRVTATDVQLEAIRNARENVAALGLSTKVEVIHSDVFENVSGRYDVVMANLPFMVTSYVMNDIATETYARFFSALDSHLSPEGTAFLTFASWGDLTTLQDMISGSRFVCERYTESNGNLQWYVFALKSKNMTSKQPRIPDKGI